MTTKKEKEMSKNIKFELTSESITVLGVKLFRIKATCDIENIGVKKGELGGYVEKESNLDQSGDAWVSGDAQVYGNARVSGNAQVYGNARVSGDAWVSGNARVYGNAQVYGDAWVSGNAQVYGNARVSGNAVLEAESSFTKGNFVGGDDSDTPTFTNITDKTGSDYWKNQYVIGDYEIKDIDGPKPEETIEIGGKVYKVTDELKQSLKNLKEV